MYGSGAAWALSGDTRRLGFRWPAAFSKSHCIRRIHESVYLGHFAPSLAAGHRGAWLGLGMIVICIAWNVLGASAVGIGSVAMTICCSGRSWF